MSRLTVSFSLLKESLTYDTRLNNLEREIQKANDELRRLKTINKDAYVAKENASNEFSKFEEKVYK